MKLSTLITAAQGLLESHGDLDVLSEDDWAIEGLHLEEAEEGQYPEAYEMPAGFKFIRASDSR